MDYSEYSKSINASNDLKKEILDFIVFFYYLKSQTGLL